MFAMHDIVISNGMRLSIWKATFYEQQIALAIKLSNCSQLLAATLDQILLEPVEILYEIYNYSRCCACWKSR